MPRLDARNTESENDVQGTPRPKPGHYHAAIHHWDESFRIAPNVIFVDFQILEGTTPEQKGTVLTERFATTDKAIPRLLRMCLAAGVVKPGEELDRDLTDEAPGHQLVIEVTPRTYENKQGQQVETVQCSYMGFWSINNKEVANVPKNAGALKLLGGNGNGHSNGNGNAKTDDDDPEFAGLI